MEQTGGAPTQAAPEVAPAAEPDFMKMTGEQAKAWVDAQKAKKLEGLPTQEKKDPYLADKAKKPVSTQDMVKEAVAEAKRKLKIDDAEVDEDEVIKVFKERKGHQQAANKALQEGKQLRKQAEEFVSKLKDPQTFWDIAKKLGHDPRTLSEKQLVQVLEEELMDPRDRELKKLREERAAEQSAREAVEKQKEQERHEVLKKKFADDYNKQFVEALSQTEIPQNKYTVAEMAKYIARASEIGFKMTALEAAKLVKEDILEAQRRLIGDTDGETLIKLLGENVANKIRKWDTGRLKDPNAARVGKQDQGEVKDRKVPHKRMTPKEWREFNRR